jgi:hypothetical protein
MIKTTLLLLRNKTHHVVERYGCDCFLPVGPKRPGCFYFGADQKIKTDHRVQLGFSKVNEDFIESSPVSSSGEFLPEEENSHALDSYYFHNIKNK